MRNRLGDQLKGSNLCDGAAYARNVEAAYRDMWRQWCQGEMPAGGRLNR